MDFFFVPWCCERRVYWALGVLGVGCAGCYSSKMAIQLEYHHLLQIMEPQIVSECLRFCIVEKPLLFRPETS